MRVLVIGRSFPEKETGMLGIFEYEQAQALRAQGIESDYIFCDTRSIFRIRLNDTVQRADDEIYSIGSHYLIGRLPRPIFEKLKDARWDQVLEQYLQKRGCPDLIHIHFPTITLTEGFWNQIKRLNVPIVVTEHYTKTLNMKLNTAELKVLKMAVEESSAFLCVSEMLKESVQKLTSTGKKLMVVPNLVSNEYFAGGNQPIDSHSYTYIAVGRLVKCKCFPLVVEAFAKLAKEERNIRLVIVGGGTQQKNIERTINRCGVSKSVFMTGFLPREKTLQAIRDADAYVSASVLETFGVPFIEAMACGKPIIAADNSPILPYINEENGLVFEKNNVDSLVSAMRSIRHREYNSADIRECAKENFSSSAIGKRLQNLYETLLT